MALGNGSFKLAKLAECPYNGIILNCPKSSSFSYTTARDYCHIIHDSTVFEKRNEILIDKRQFFIPLVFNLHDPLEPLRIFVQNFNTNCASPWAIRRWENIAEKKFNYLCLGCDNVTDDRQTDDRCDNVCERNVITFVKKWCFFVGGGGWGWTCANTMLWPPKGITLREYAPVGVSHVKIGSTACARSVGRFCVQRNKKLSGNFGYTGRSNPWGDLYQMWHVGRWRNHVCNIWWLLLCGCGEKGNLAFSHWLVSALQHWSHYRVIVWFLPGDVMYKRGLYRHAVSVCPSIRLSRSWILSKWVIMSSNFFQCRVAKPF